MQSTRVRREFAALGAAGVTAIFLAWPVPFSGAMTAWGSQWDLLNNLWFFDYARKAITHRDFSFATDMVLFPFGYDLRLDLIHFMVPLFSVPLQIFGNPVVAYNILLILILTFNFYTGYRLALYLTDDHMPAALAAGVAWAASPLVFADMYVGSIELTACGVIPLAILAFLRLWGKGGWSATFQAAGALIFACLTSWLYGAFTMVALAVLAPSYRNWRGMRRWLVAGIGTMALCLPIIILVVKDDLVGAHLRLDLSKIYTKDVIRDRESYRPPIPLTTMSLDALADIRYSEIINDSIELGNLYPAKSLGKPYRAFPHLPLLLLGIAGAVIVLVRRRSATTTDENDSSSRRASVPGWRWIGLGTGALVLSLGPFWQLSAANELQFRGFPLPYYFLYQHIPFFTVFYRPHRFVALLILALAMLVALGIARASRRETRQPHPNARLPAAWVAAIMIMLAIMLEFGIQRARVQFKPVSIHVPAFYYELAKDPEQYAIIELPCAPIPVNNHNARFAFYQTVHNKKTYNMTLLRPWHWYKVAEMARANRFFAQLIQFPERDAEVSAAIGAADIESFRKLGFRYIVAHTQVPAPTAMEAEYCGWLATLCGPPRAWSDGIQAFDIRNPPAAATK